MPPRNLSPYSSPDTRVQTWVSASDRDAVHSVGLLRGFDNYSLALFYQSIAKIITDHGLSYTDRARFQSFIDSLPAVIRAAGEGHFKNEQGGVTGTLQPAAVDKNQPTNNGKAPAGGRPGRRRTSGGGEK